MTFARASKRQRAPTFILIMSSERCPIWRESIRFQHMYRCVLAPYGLIQPKVARRTVGFNRRSAK